MKVNFKKRLTFGKMVFIIPIIIFVFGCNNSTKPEKPKERWKKINSFGENTMTGLYLNSDKTKLSVTTTDEFGLILPDKVEPTIVTALESHIDEDYLEYIPYFDDEYYFSCDRDGQIMYVGDNSNGELVGTIPITSIVDSVNLPAKFTPSYCMYSSKHIESNNNGLYMISIRQTDVISNNWQDDRLYFGTFENQKDSLAFNVEKVITSYSEPSSASVSVYSNYYYGGYFWQYRTDSFHLSVTAVNENGYEVNYLDFGSYIRYAFEYNGYTIGLFDLPVRKSYDGGFTWEDWISFNASWNHVMIQGKHIFFYSHNIASIDFETLETKNYNRGELDSHCIIGMAEFDGKVFAATVDGLYYCAVEDFFVLKPEETIKNENDLNLKIKIN